MRNVAGVTPEPTLKPGGNRPPESAREALPVSRDGHSPTRDEELENESTAALELLRNYSRTRDIRLRDQLVLHHERLVRHLAGRFAVTGGVTQEDLVQVGYLGLIAAIERFDPDRGISFTTFALPTIVGEIKRYLRDQTWLLKAPRRLRELGLSLRKLRGELEHQLGRAPTVKEIAEAAGVSEERLLQAMEVDRIYQPGSLDAAISDSANPDRAQWDGLGEIDPEYTLIEDRESLLRAMEHLDERQRAILYYRFYEEATQAEVAGRLGMSQMHVSRLERQALRKLRALLS